MFPRRLLKGSLLARKPECNGQFRLSPTQSSHLFFWINPLNMDNGHFSVPRITNSHTSSTPLYGRWVFVHCYLYMCVNCKHCIPVSVQVMKDFYGLVRFYWRVSGKRQTWICRGGSRIFFRRGCTRLLLYFNTNKPHFFFFWGGGGRIPVVLENCRSSQWGGGHTPCTLPLDPPLICTTWTSFLFYCRLLFIITTRKSLVSCQLYPWELL